MCANRRMEPNQYTPGMSLNTYVAEKRLALFDVLRAGREPLEGSYDRAVLAEAKLKGAPQMGATRYTPHTMAIEFIYPDTLGAATLLTITLEAPERIVFLPVPEWVIETIWQGEIDGSYQFESDAHVLFEALLDDLTPENNAHWFGPRVAKRRE